MSYTQYSIFTAPSTATNTHLTHDDKNRSLT